MSLSRLDSAELGAILSETALKEVVPHFRKLGDDDIRMKSSTTDLVTEADKAAEC
ncbi:MAG: hypothetical protein IOC35_08925 [Methylobacterium sp.]|jgi:fructose-1,6-bisphosphatase/inositol monophosphatase family enzyme|nr:hypothetical protein [Methylobacterium sp.]